MVTRGDREMFRIRKSFTFEAAHQLESAVTKACFECIHGHSYTVELCIVSSELDGMEMVVDFGTLKRFKEEIMLHWDHGLLLHESKRSYIEPLIAAGVLKAEKVTFLPKSPTAEVMADILFRRLTTFLFDLAPQVRVHSVRVHETSTGWAERFNTSLPVSMSVA